ncbi:hypothetical protein HQN89_03935 [Paenibacillus frigoriresistens]|uniref:hypothetical protein n=1 Tax=Paenibacillus alginolyticus TaxID=59839 RepID=UPI0015653DC5|nr:hypothetical protein [Paenibacillus frigoriresistens]NRF90185.1 hypothetical protein [Paenibacillus frigoriresistens]
MTLERVVKWLGFLCVLAGIIRMGMTPSSLVWGDDSTPEVICGFAACILMAVSSIALYMAQSRETGVLGFITALLISIGNLLVASNFYGLFAYGFYAKEGAFASIMGGVSGMGMLLGTIILAILTFRAKVFPRWTVILMVIMLVSFGLPWLDKWFAFFWGLSYVGMGFLICTGRHNKGPAAKIEGNISL